MRPIYARFGHALPEKNGDESWVLPIPATNVMDRDGRHNSRVHFMQPLKESREVGYGHQIGRGHTFERQAFLVLHSRLDRYSDVAILKNPGLRVLVFPDPQHTPWPSPSRRPESVTEACTGIGHHVLRADYSRDGLT